MFETYSGEVIAPVSGVVPERNQHTYFIVEKFYMNLSNVFVGSKTEVQH